MGTLTYKRANSREEALKMVADAGTIITIVWFNNEAGEFETTKKSVREQIASGKIDNYSAFAYWPHRDALVIS